MCLSMNIHLCTTLKWYKRMNFIRLYQLHVMLVLKIFELASKI